MATYVNGDLKMGCHHCILLKISGTNFSLLPQNNFMDNNKKHSPDNPQNQGAREGEYKNVETSVNNPSYFNDDYESQQEDELTEEEPKTEKEEQKWKRVRGIDR